MNIFGLAILRTWLFLGWSVKTWPEVKGCWWPPMIRDRKIRAWITWGDLCDKKLPMNVLVKVCTRKMSPTSDLFWVFVWTLHFFWYKVLRYIQTLPPEDCKTRTRTRRGSKHAMGVGRTCALYLVFRHGQIIRKHTHVQWFSTWNKAKSHPQQLCFFPYFPAWKSLYLTTVAWKSLLLSWKKSYTPVNFSVRKVGKDWF